MNGQFVISLDFEKYWGVFDSLATGNYNDNLNNVDFVIERLLNLSHTYQIKLTFATVGFLFNRNKQDYIKNIPEKIPTYRKEMHNPYPLIENIEPIENIDSIYYGRNALLKIKEAKTHEISTHTYCHYYCLEDGQTLDQFDADIKMAKKVASDLGIKIKSIVFPRNQVNNDYLEICKKNEILSYRGVEDHFIYEAKSKDASKKSWHRALRLADSYFNITGSHTHKFSALKEDQIINIPSSRFFRPFSRKLSFLEPFKVKRVIKAMTKAAKNRELYHLWFHPHNFGNNITENFNNLETIFKTFSTLNKEFGFESTTMSECANKIKNC